MLIEILKTVKLSSNLYLRAGDRYSSPLPKEVVPYVDRPEFVKVLIADQPEAESLAEGKAEQEETKKEQLEDSNLTEEKEAKDQPVKKAVRRRKKA